MLQVTDLVSSSSFSPYCLLLFFLLLAWSLFSAVTSDLRAAGFTGHAALALTGLVWFDLSDCRKKNKMCLQHVALGCLVLMADAWLWLTCVFLITVRQVEAGEFVAVTFGDDAGAISLCELLLKWFISITILESATGWALSCFGGGGVYLVTASFITAASGGR